MTDRRTDGQTDAQGKTICLPTLKGGGDITNKKKKRNVGVTRTNKGNLNRFYDTATSPSAADFKVDLMVTRKEGGNMMMSK